MRNHIGLKKERDQMMPSQERVLKSNKVILKLFQELFISKFQYQNSTKWWYPHWLGLSLLKSRSFLGILPKVSQTKFYQIKITKSKVIHVQIPVPKWEKNEKVGKTFLGYKMG